MEAVARTVFRVVEAVDTVACCAFRLRVSPLTRILTALAACARGIRYYLVVLLAWLSGGPRAVHALHDDLTGAADTWAASLRPSVPSLSTSVSAADMTAGTTTTSTPRRPPISARIAAYILRFVLPADCVAGLAWPCSPLRPGDASVATAHVGWLLRRERPACFHDPTTAAAWHARGRVAEAVLEPLPHNRGLVGQLFHLHVTFAGGARDTIGNDERNTPATYATMAALAPNASAPLRLIVKMSYPTVAARQNVRAAGQAREAFFFSSTLAGEVRRVLPGVLPAVLEAHGSDILGEYVLVMEDVTQRPRGAVGVNLLLGNQVWGTPPGAPPPLDDPLPLLRRVFSQAAVLHAHFWNDPRLPTLPWLKAVPWRSGHERMRWEGAVDAARRYWHTAQTRWDAHGSGVELSHRVRALVTNSLAAASWAALQQRLRSRDAVYTLTHGDFHAANMLQAGANRNPDPNPNPKHRPNPDPDANPSHVVALVDWSEVGLWEPTVDLGQMLLSDVRPEVARAHARPLLEHYWHALVAARPALAENYPLERCWNDFCRTTVERWTFLFAVLAGFQGMPPALVRWFHDNLESFVETFYQGGDTCTITTLVVIQ